jgi:hypothetical protein
MKMKKMIRRCVGTISVMAIVLTAFTSQAAQLPQTTAESSGYNATSRKADVMAFIHELQRQSNNIRVETLATTAEGFDIPMLILGNPPPRSPSELQFDDRAVVYIQANIHAGEVEGKEAAQMLARDILFDPANDYLDKLVVLITPVFNADGNDKISPDNRSRQNGPEQGVGVRYNGLNQDLNRDGMKLESPEVQGLVQNVLNKWDPVFFFDAHTHNGSYHQAAVTWTWGLSPNGDPSIYQYMNQSVWPEIASTMLQEHGLDTIPHGDFVDVKNPEKGWVPLPPHPRYLSNLVGLRNRLSVLNEQYPYADFKTRVMGAYHLMHAFLGYLHEHKTEVVNLVRKADSNAIARGLNPSKEDHFVTRFEAQPIDRKFTIEGYDMEVTDQPGGRPQVKPLLDKKRSYKDVPYYANYTTDQYVQLPRGYLIATHDQALITKIRQHGVAVEKLQESAKLNVEAYSVTRLSGAARSSEGHYANSVEGQYLNKEMEFPAGTYYISMAQPLGNLAAALLEPEAQDGLLYWNYFDRYLSYQFQPVAKEYPVYKLHQRVNLVTEYLP